MALKRINKELTDLGRFVDPHLFTAARPVCGAALQARSHAITNDLIFSIKGFRRISG
jgi:hypothetical protein